MKRTEAPPRPGTDPQWDSAWAELRELLVGPEREEIGAIRRHLGSRDEQIESVAEILPPAVERSARNGPELRRSLEPMVREVIELTLKHDPGLLIDSALPVIGTLIRRYISTALQDFVDAINIAQEKALSIRSLQWRLEAWRTGKPFADVVLANSLLYRVEQVFLIHHPSGLLLLHRTASGVIAKDGDMVSGMLTAIGDFARDSFEETPGDGSELNTVQIGELRIWVRHAPHSALAAVVRGVAPPDLKVLLDKQLALIEQDFGEPIEHYQGDPSTVQGAAPHVDACLVGRGGVENRKNGVVYAGAAVALMVLLAIGTLWWKDNTRWKSDIARLEAEPGYAVTEARRGWFRHTISVLRDPLAKPPESVLAEPARYSMRFTPFVSLDPEMAALREYEPARRRVEGFRLEFANDSAVIDRIRAEAAAEAIRRLLAAAPLAGKQIRVTVTGSADPTGTAERNRKLSIDRAEATVQALADAGIDPSILAKAPGTSASREVRFAVHAAEAEK